MGLETGTYISDLVSTNPVAADPKSQGDDHLRLIKATVKATFPNISGAVTPTHTELNYVDGVTSAIQTQIDTKGAIAGQTWTGTHVFPSTTSIGNVSDTEISYLDGVTSAVQTQIDNLNTAKAALAGATYTGTHNFAGATTTVATPSAASDAVTKSYADGLAFATALPSQTGNSGKFVTTNGTTASWAAIGISRSARTSNTILGVADQTTLVDITSGTFTQTFTAAATLGSGWYCYIKNSGTGDITLDPNGSETIDGLTSYIMYPQEVRLVQCTGTAFTSVVLHPFTRDFLSTGTFVTPPGYVSFGGYLWGAGGSGGRGATAASGGGGGACVPFFVSAAALGTSTTVTIGAGGAARTTDNTGATGGTTYILTKYAYGGSGGGAGGSSSQGGGGGGALGAGSIHNGSIYQASGGGAPSLGAMTSSTNAVVGNPGLGGANAQSSAAGGDGGYGGGAGGSTTGGSSAGGGNSVYGGAGGGAAGGGGGGAGGVSWFGGAGGAASVASNGTAGAQPGGGGGATNTGTQSGAGGDGKCTIWGVA